jgi:hypothetical protein
MRPKPPPPPGAERRRHARYDLIAQVELELGGEVSLLEVANVSAGGLLIERAAGEGPELAVGDEVSVYLDLGPGDGGDPVEIAAEAQVVRVAAESIALMWSSADPAVAAAISRALAHIRDA